MIDFTATDEQIKQIAANAVNASVPVGLGFLQATRRVFVPADFDIDGEGLFLDYVEGRMVKLNLRRVAGDRWEMPGGPPRLDYQSWAAHYPTYQNLIDSVLKSTERILPATCTLNKSMLQAILQVGREFPCDRCNMSRKECQGYPRADGRDPDAPTAAEAST